MEADPNDIRLFRPMVGFIAVVGSFAAFIGLFLIEIPARNENALMFAMGIIFGWGSSVFASEYGASNVGRKVAEASLKRLDLEAGGPAPKDAREAADQVADKAVDEAAHIGGRENEKPV